MAQDLSSKAGVLYNKVSISIEQARKLIDNPALSDKEVEALVSAGRMLASILYEKWLQERKLINSTKD